MIDKEVDYNVASGGFEEDTHLCPFESLLESTKLGVGADSGRDPPPLATRKLTKAAPVSRG